MRSKKRIKFFLFLFLVFLILCPFLFSPNSGDYINAERYIENFNIEGGSFLEVDRYKTYHIDVNSSSEKVIILVHGLGGSATNWIPVIPELEQAGFRVLALDLKGSGLSEKKIGEDFSHKAQVEFLNSFVEQLELESFTLVGHSMGGNIATMYVQKYPKKVERLVLVSPAIVEIRNFDPVRANALKALDFPVIKEYVRVFLKTFFTEERIKAFFESAMYDPEKASVAEPLFVNPTRFAGWEYVAIKMTASTNENILERPLLEIKIPVLIVWGEKDPWIPMSEGKYLQQKFINNEFVILENVGHLPMFEDAERFSEVLTNFLP